MMRYCVCVITKIIKVKETKYIYSERTKRHKNQHLKEIYKKKIKWLNYVMKKESVSRGVHQIGSVQQKMPHNYCFMLDTGFQLDLT